MGQWIPQSLRGEQLAVEEVIRAAFKGVKREGGASWTEAGVIDNGGSDEACAAARAFDTEQCWEELIEDWRMEPGHPGEWTLLDAVGLRYYRLRQWWPRCGEVRTTNSLNTRLNAELMMKS